MKLHLYEFRHPEYDGIADDLVQWVISSLPPDKVRDCSTWDHGGTPSDLFYKTFQDGTWRELHSLADLAETKTPGWLRHRAIDEILPFVSDEPVFCEELGGQYLYLDITMRMFFEEYYGKEFPDN